MIVLLPSQWAFADQKVHFGLSPKMEFGAGQKLCTAAMLHVAVGGLSCSVDFRPCYIFSNLAAVLVDVTSHTARLVSFPALSGLPGAPVLACPVVAVAFSFPAHPPLTICRSESHKDEDAYFVEQGVGCFCMRLPGRSAADGGPPPVDAWAAAPFIPH